MIESIESSGGGGTVFQAVPSPQPERLCHQPDRLCHVALVGAGLIGSAAAGELTRMPGLARVTVIDPDDYEVKNLAVQQIDPRDVGRPKAVVQARRIARAAPGVRTDAIVDRVANVPPGLLMCDAILACVDTKAARRDINEVAWHLGVPWIDSGVSAAGGLLARVNVYVPAPGAPCHECTWDDGDYRNIEVPHPCTKHADLAAPTNSPAYLGSLAAAIQVAELTKLLGGRTEHLAAGKSILISALHHSLDVTAIPRNPACRFDHEIWQIRPLQERPGQMTFGCVLDLARSSGNDGAAGTAALAVEGRPFVRRLACESCGAERDVLYPVGRPGGGEKAPCACGGPMSPVGRHLADEIDLADLDAPSADRLSRAGLAAGDVLRLTDSSGRSVRYAFGWEPERTVER